MSEYHNQEAMERRLAERRRNPQLPLPLRVFYHIACMGQHWQEVVNEQLRLLAHVGLTEATAGLLGTKEQAGWCRQRAQELGVRLDVPIVLPDFGLYEGPTLTLAHDWALAHPEGSVLYFHTKGVSNPQDPYKPRWRRMMQRYVLVDWRDNLNRLAVADMVGVSWQEQPDFPHFCGNFWMARCDWLAHLEPPLVYCTRRPDFNWAGGSWRKRFYVETWIGSRGYHHIESLVCRNGNFWSGRQVFDIDVTVPGFAYGDE